MLTLFNKLTNIIDQNLLFIKSYRNVFELKNDNSPVSKGDIFLQKLIIDFFKSEIENLVIISEELNNAIIQPVISQPVLIIDPIDGTENYVSGLPIWGVAVSLWYYPIHKFSYIYLPELNKIILSGQRLNYYSSRINGLSSSLNEQLINLIDFKKEYRIMGCSVFNFYNVITKSFKTFENTKGAYVWDLIAGLNLALEHGCKVLVEGRDYNGEFLDPNRKHSFKIINK